MEVIDNQHRRIVDYINALHDASLTQNRGEIAKVLEQLVEYTLSHFAFEEEMQAEAGYPFVKAHQKVHQLFVRRVSEFKQRFERGEDIAEPLLSLLRTWLINHIRRDDADYVDLVKKNVLKIEPKPDKKWWKRLFA
ncbi:MAG: bacteriohemerythrin [Thiopseudomonas sp.]|nr:bacteriohemerythrin [Thiopseudomonas sp.]